MLGLWERIDVHTRGLKFHLDVSRNTLGEIAFAIVLAMGQTGERRRRRERHCLKTPDAGTDESVDPRLLR